MAPGNAIDLDGTDDAVTCGDVHRFTGTSEYTLEAWVKPATLDNDYVIQKYDAPNDGWAVSISDTGALRSFRRAESTTVDVTSGSTMSTGNWYHVATTYDGSTLRVYIDAAPDGSVATALSMGGTAVEMAIGGSSIFDGYFNGQIDEVRIWT